jgi:hypothetical protein
MPSEIVTALRFKNEKFMEHVLKLQSIGFGLTWMQLRKTAFKILETRFKLIPMLRKVW